MNSDSVAVVIPAFQAEEHIKTVIDKIPSWVDYIIVVNDCSYDTTKDIVEEIIKTNEKVFLINHEINRGLGVAMMNGYMKAYDLGAEVIVKMDSDDQMNPDYLIELITPILNNEADYTKGNRFLHEMELSSMPFIRRVGNIGLSFLVKMASGYWNIFDPSNGYTAIHVSMFPLLNIDRIGKRYYFETSMLVELGLISAVVKDVYIPARYGEEKSNLSIIKTIFEFPPKLLKSFFRRLIVEYFFRDFGIFSLFSLSGIIIFFSGLFMGLFNWISNLKKNVPTPTGTIMLAVLLFILGFQLILQAIVLDIQNVPKNPIHMRKANKINFQDRINDKPK